MALDLFQDFQRITRALEQGNVEYAVVGALAVAIHGVSRATTDIDLLVRPADVPRILALVRALGFDLEAAPMRFSDGMELRRVTRVEGREALTLDLLLLNDNLQSIWESRISIDTEDGPLWVISREALIRMKTAAGRPRDLGDIASLEEQDR